MKATNVNSESKYAKKRRSGKMIYGPSPSVPKSPDFKAKYPPSDEYWWGEKRDKRA